MAIKEDRFVKTVVDSGGFSDSRMEIYAEALQTLPPGSFSERIYALEKKIYKPSEME